MTKISETNAEEEDNEKDKTGRKYWNIFSIGF